jgi:hypothetical protein
MRTRKGMFWTAAGALGALAVITGLTLAGPIYAQKQNPHGMGNMGQMGGMQGHMGMMGMMGPMKMTGAMTMNGKPYNMRCNMTPIGKPKGMMGGKMGHMGMGGMMMNQPMKMSGTMTMMGQKYRCDMTMTPRKAAK